LWLTTQPQIITPKTTPNCLGTSQGTTLGDALEQHQVVAKGLQGETKFHRSTTLGCPKEQTKFGNFTTLVSFVLYLFGFNMGEILGAIHTLLCHHL
jgi:hypothetical protein